MRPGWPRGSESNIAGINSGGLPICNDTTGAAGAADYMPDAPNPSLNLITLTDNNATLTGYTYELFDNNGNSAGWWPRNPTDIVKFAYTLYLDDPSIQGTAGLVEETKSFEFQIYPNPTEGLTTIKFTTPLNETSQVVLTDLTGKLVMNLINDANSRSESELTFSVNNVSSGVYFVTLINKEMKLTKRLIIQ